MPPLEFGSCHFEAKQLLHANFYGLASHHTGFAATKNAHNNQRTQIKIARDGVLECHLSPNTIKNSIFDLRLSILTYLIAPYPVWSQ